MLCGALARSGAIFVIHDRDAKAPFRGRGDRTSGDYVLWGVDTDPLGRLHVSRRQRSGRRRNLTRGAVAWCLAAMALLAPIVVASPSARASGQAQTGMTQAASTFGKTSVGASSDMFVSERKRVNRYALAEPGSVTKLSVYLVPTATSGQQLMKGLIYADTGTAPGALLAVSEQFTFKSTNVAGWYELVFSSPVKLAAGNYWIGVMTGATAGVAGFRYDSVTGSRDWNANAYASGPTNPFGSITSDSERTSLYATYTQQTSRPVNTTAPIITGTAQQGQTLTEHNGTWTNEPTSFTYQWLQCDSLGNSCLPISGATSQTYVPVAADVGHALEVQETASNAAGPGAPVPSQATARVIAVIPANIAPPTITGAAQQGQTLTEHNGSWTNEPTSFTYQWQQCDGSGNNCVPISGATTQTYGPLAGDLGHTIRVQEAASNAGGTSSPATSVATAIVTPPVPTNNTPPTITGTAQQGQTLTEHNGSWTNEPTSFTYQWQQCDSLGNSCLPISGAAAQTYTLVAADVGSTLRVAVTASNSAGASAPATSVQTIVVTQVTATFGKTTIGASPDTFVSERKRVNRYALAEPGTVTKLTVYLVPTATSGSQVMKGIIYADTGTAPGALVAVTEQFTFKSTNVAGWYELLFSTPVKLAAGNYWIGVMTGATAGVASFRYDSVTGSRDWNANAYASGPTNPFGSANADSEQTSLYATYTSVSDTTPPTQPEGLRAAAAGPTQINLSWEPSSDNVGVAGYTIRRDGVVLASTGTSGTSYSDTGLAPATAYTYTVDAYDAAGNHSPQSVPASATTSSFTGIQHYEYVFPSNAIDVYDMDNGQKLIKTIALPQAATDIRGAVASPTTHVLYVSYGGDGGSHGGGSLLAYDLVNEKVIWTHFYSEGIDSMAISPDGKTIYMPVGEESSASTWNVVDAGSGSVLTTIEGGKGPHNTIVSLNGQHVYMGGRNASYLTVAETSNDHIIKQIGPLLSGGVRPFTINGRETLAFTTATGFLGFQVSSITTGQVLYTAPVTGPYPYTPGQPGPSSPSHGISLSPDEKELWVIDEPNSYVHVFDITGLPASAPKQIANIKLRAMTGTQAGCTYDCLREGWLQHSLDGRFVYVGDSGDVIDTTTRQSVANLEPLVNSRVFLEIDWSNGLPVATSSRSGLGYVTK
jgi:hypothetical protein